MEQRVLGRTGLPVSAIGFGGAGIAQEYGATTVEEGLNAIAAALEAGITFFDVAPSYGSGLAERVLGKALVGRREDATIMTKVDLLPTGRDDIASFTLQSVSDSLERLGTEYVDVLLVHNAVTSKRSWPYEWCIELDDAFRMADAFDQLRAEGRVRNVGFSAWRCTARALESLFASDRFDVIQSEYNLLNTSAIVPVASGTDLGVMAELELEPDEVTIAAYDYRGTDQHLSIARAREIGIGTVAIRPLMGGVLSDSLDREAPEGSDLKRMRRRADILKAALGQDGLRLSDAAIRYCLMPAEVDTVILGFKNSTEVHDAVNASLLPPLTAAQVAIVQQVVLDATPPHERTSRESSDSI